MLKLQTQKNRNYEEIYLMKEQIPLLHKLKDYSIKNLSCFDVPGHVKDQGVEVLNKYLGNQIMCMDINSSPTMDNVSNPNGVIEDSQKLLAKAYSCDEAFFITNGTTQAIQAMILSVINPNDKILLPRNIHKSVINALILSGGDPIFIHPEFNEELGISLNLEFENIKKVLEDNCDIKALFLLNPTYYGACADLDKIIKYCKEKGVLVLVDEAHGAHFPFHDSLPPSSMSLGADMSAVSIHKTGGALTQASALLVNKINVDIGKIRQIINMLQSTSASYLLMASIDGARYNLVKNGKSQLSKVLDLAKYAKSRLDNIKGIKVASTELVNYKGASYIDESKLCINTRGMNLTGFEVYDLLYKEFNTQVELGDLYNVLALVSIGTTKDDIDRLVESIEKISKEYFKIKKINLVKIKQLIPDIKYNPRDAFYMEKESIDMEKCINRISGESIMAYPPGIPIIAPGEVITKDIIDYIKALKQNNAYLTDMKDKNLKTILVIK
ncbi:MAG: aminotransferase class I/II-fold pyridoxal phosphate-dependent enzyme [Romboutsia sp.]|uniref:aminotransferase class I/II-fold pyridoxal phosphate-dependent enzyme n=1 Tax=Romboutsia sp. TaxID=1965302 RepID=UPI003F33D517